MRTISTLKSFFVFFTLLSTVCAYSQPLTGTKTIGGSSPDYATFAAAVSSLNSNGVGAGGVTFLIRNMTETLSAMQTISAIGSAANPIVFKSENENASLVTLQRNNTPITISGQFIRFEHITITNTGSSGSAIILGTNADNNMIDNCVLNGNTGATTTWTNATIYSSQTTNGNGVDNFILRNSTIRRGSIGIYMVMNSTERPGGLVIENNVFEDFNYRGAIYFEQLTAPLIDGNTFRTSIDRTITHVINLGYCQGGTKVINNYIYTTGAGKISVAINIAAYSAGSLGNNAILANNSIQVENASSIATGISIANSAKYWDIYNNTIFISGGTSASNKALNSNASNADINIHSNIFVDASTGSGTSAYLVYIPKTGGCSSIGNNCYWWTESPNYKRCRINSTTIYTTFAAHIAGTGETNSFNIDPQMTFVDGVGWKATASGLEGAGVYNPAIPKDIDGKNRLNPTTVGAHENAAVSNPNIVVSTPTLSHFFASVGIPSDSQTYTVEGDELIGDIVITAPNHFEIREQGVGNFGSSLSFTPSMGNVSAKTVEVRYNPSVASTLHTGNVTHTSPNAETRTVALSANSSNCTSPFAGIYTINPSQPASCTNYQSFESAISDMINGERTDNNAFFNGPGIDGAVVFELASGTYTEAITINNISGASETNTVTFRPAANATVTLSYNSGKTIDLQGANYIIFDGRRQGLGTDRYFTIENTHTSGHTIHFIDGASNNVFRYCIIRGVNTATLNANKGVIRFSTASTSSVETANNNNIFEYNQIRDGNTTPRRLIYASGTSLKPNTDNIISNNEFFNFYQNSGDYCAIDISSYNTDWIISNNHFYQTETRTSSAGDAYAIHISNTSDGRNFQITGNYIGGSQANAGGSAWTENGTSNSTFTGIYINTDQGSNSVTSHVFNNTITNIRWNCQANASNIWCGIYALNGDIYIGDTAGTGNIIGSPTGNDAIIVNTNTNGATSYGILFSNPVNSNKVRISDNKIGSITLTSNSPSNSHNFTGIHTGTADVTISNNLIGSLTTPNSIHTAQAATTTGAYAQKIFGIKLLAGSGTNTIINNTIANIHNNYQGTSLSGQLRGIVTTAGSQVIVGNTIFNLSTNSASLGIGVNASITAISQEQANQDNHEISENVIYGLSNNSGVDNVEINGIYYNGTSSTSSLSYTSRNFIHSLSANGGSARINAIHIDKSTGCKYANNMIRLGIDANGNSINGNHKFVGILVNSESTGSKGQQIIFNTIYIGGTATSGNSNTYVYKRENAISSNPTESVLNNIFHNARTNLGGSGKHYAVSIPNNNSVTTSNYNVFSAEGIGGIIGEYNNTDYNTIEDWRTASGLDANSHNATPIYLNVDGNAVDIDLRLDGTKAVNANNLIGKGTYLALYPNDYFDTDRANPPTIGAHETTAFVPACVAPTLNAKYNSEDSKTICEGQGFILSANPQGGENCDGTWEYAWYNESNQYWNGATWAAGETWGDYEYIGNVAPTTTTIYKVKVRCSEDPTCTVEDAVGVIVTVNPNTVGGMVSSNQQIIYDSQPADLTLNGYTGDIIEWQKDVASAFTNPVTIGVTNSTLSGANIGNLTETTYFRAIVQSGVCSPTFSSFVEIEVLPQSSLSCSDIISPANGSPEVPIISTLEWTSVDDATIYSVYIDTVNPPLQYRTTVIHSEPSMMLNTNLYVDSYNTKYYWRIVPKNETDSIGGCAVWSFTTEAITCPQIIAPEDNATGVSITQILYWEGKFGAVAYDVYFGETEPLTLVAENITENYYIPTLEHEKEYLWKIVPKTANSSVADCDVFSFTVMPQPFDAALIWKTTAENSDWNQASNWWLEEDILTSTYAPTSSNDVYIPSGAAFYPIINNSKGSPAECKDILIAPNANITIDPNKAMTIYGSLENNGKVIIRSTGVSGGSVHDTNEGSLIIKGNESGSGIYTIDRYISGNYWHMVSSPITSAKASVFMNMWIRDYEESNNLWGSFISSPTIPFIVGKGYSIWTYETSEIRTFQGKINHGDISMQVQYTNSGLGASQQGWNLIGNPYTSAIEWVPTDVNKWIRTNVSPTIYIFSATSGNYIVYNPNYPGNNGRFIAMSQGFFVQATNQSPSLILKKDACLHHEVYFRDEIVKQDILTISVAGNKYTDESYISYRENANDSYDYEYDAVKFAGLSDAPQLFTQKQEGGELIDLAANSVNNIENLHGKKVFLKVGIDGEYKLNFVHSFVQNFEPVMRDRKTNDLIYVDTEYTFLASTADAVDRFEILDKGLLSTPDLNTHDLSMWTYDNNLHIGNLQNEKLRQVIIYNILGSEVMTSSMTKINLNSLSRGVYLVKVMTNKQTVVRKISVQ